jgi:hypothetical protein
MPARRGIESELSEAPMVNKVAASPDAAEVPADVASPSTAPKLSLMAWAAFLLTVFVMSMRRLYIAPDDGSYLDYFRGVQPSGVSSWWLRALDEPLWLFYSSWAGSWLGDETAFRITLAAVILIFLYCSTALGRGAPFLILAGFIVDATIGTQMYFNQIRQGVALSLFLAVSWFARRRPRLAIWTGAGLAALTHSSFLILFLVTIVTLSLRRRVVGITLSIVASLVAILLFRETAGNLELGRRSTYAFTSILNANFFIFSIPKYVVTLFLAHPDPEDPVARRWYDVALALVAAAFIASAVHEAGARLFYICDALIFVVLAQNIRKPRVQFAATFWMIALVFGIVTEGYNLNFNQDSWTGRWALILSG